MNNYKNVIETAKNLRDEFGNKLTTFESLQIAAQIQISESLTHGLQEGYANEPAFLEAIAIALGYKKGGSDTIISTLKKNNQED